MDDIQTILYIVIGVIYLLVRVLKKKKSPVAPPTAGQAGEPVLDDTVDGPKRKKPLSFEELIREISGEKIQEEEAKPIEQPQPAKRQPLVSDTDAQAAYQESVKQAQRLKKRASTKAAEIEKAHIFESYEIEETGQNYLAEEIAKSLKNSHDLKKAIVINEILTRKYD